MTTASVITAGVNAVILALTPTQRWQAARRLNSDSMDVRWFVLISVIVIIVLTALLIIATYNRALKERRAANQLFLEHANKMGLSQRERQILLDISARAKLQQSESIFTMANAFYRGAAEVTKEARVQHGVEASKSLSAELSILREKLGFKEGPDVLAAPGTRSDKPSSRQIATGRKLHVTRRKTGDLATVESTVLENNDAELTVKLKVSLESRPGELWSVRYYFGASVWEFETSSISCHGDILVLNHSDNIRFVNRRRFLRVPVNKPTFIARFPFVRMFLPDSDSGEGTWQGSASASGSTWGPPEFVAASVTELAGPGLRIEAPLEVQVGDRVLVVLKLSEENQKSRSRKTGKATPARIVEDIGEVRHCKRVRNGFSIAVELTRLSDSDISELIRATNAASLKDGAKSRNALEPVEV